MSFSINTNIQSLLSQRALRVNTGALEKNIENLSTGQRINRASDNPAGHSISSKLSTELLGLDKAKQNASDGISMIQTAEGSMEIIQDNIQRIRELVVQGLNETNSPDEKGALQREINERVELISDLGQTTNFNGQDLLYNATDKIIQTGANITDTTRLRFESGLAANTGIDIDVDYVVTNTSDSDFGHLVEGTTTGFALDRLQIPGSNVDSQGYSDHSTNFTANLDDIDTLLANVSRMRSYLGAMQNTFESKLDYISLAAENSEASRSRITDVDIAKESSKLIQNQVLQQTASSMLVQANSLPQTILNLLPR